MSQDENRQLSAYHYSSIWHNGLLVGSYVRTGFLILGSPDRGWQGVPKSKPADSLPNQEDLGWVSRAFFVSRSTLSENHLKKFARNGAVYGL